MAAAPGVRASSALCVVEAALYSAERLPSKEGATKRWPRKSRNGSSLRPRSTHRVGRVADAGSMNENRRLDARSAGRRRCSYPPQPSNSPGRMAADYHAGLTDRARR